jgi:hypothetical protein
LFSGAASGVVSSQNKAARNLPGQLRALRPAAAKPILFAAVRRNISSYCYTSFLHAR